MTAQLALGTAQFGLAYGVVNEKGRLSAAEAAAIVGLARDGGIRFIDTAPSYGDAEEVLGQCGVAGFSIVSKVSRIGDANVRSAIIESGRRSAARLGCERLDGLLLHSADDLSGSRGAEVYKGLLAGRDAGVCKRIGVSIYDPEELTLVLDRYPMDIVQCPLSVLDRRMMDGIAKLAERGMAVHARSVFLQGILLQPPSRLAAKFAPLLPALNAFRDRALNRGMTTVEAALSFVRGVPGVECVVVGVTGAEDFLAITKAFKAGKAFKPDGLAVPPPDMIDPRRWNM